MKTFVLAAALAVIATVSGAQSARDSLPDATGLPKGIVQLSPLVLAMGEHWGNPADMPLGPIYCVQEGRVVCLEFMIAQEDLAAGKSWPALTGMEGLPPVNHTDIHFQPQGHEGYEVPHYDIHLYFLNPEEIAAIR